MYDRETLRLWGNSVLLPAILTLFYALAPYGLDYDIHQTVYRRIDYSLLQENQKEAAKAYFAKVSFRDFADHPDKADEDTRQRMILDGTRNAFWSLELGLYLSLVPFALLFISPLALSYLEKRAGLSERALLINYRLAWQITAFVAIVNTLLPTALFAYGVFMLRLVVLHFIYWPTIVLLAALSGLMIWRALRALFKRIPNEIREPDGATVKGGEELEASRPVNDVASRLNIESPSQILTGFHYCYYYVTELAVLGLDGKVEGRTLYVPNLVQRHLTFEEQKAILAHELAHYSTTGKSMTCEFFALHRRVFIVTQAFKTNGRMGRANMHLVRYFYRKFEPVVRSRMKLRELEADATAASVTSPETLARALVKIQAFGKIFEDLGEWIEENPSVPLSSLNLREVGREDFRNDPGFWEGLLGERMHHPLDIHPSLQERLQALGFALTAQHLQAIALEG